MCIVGWFGFTLVMLLAALVVLAARVGCARLLGLGHVRFWPLAPTPSSDERLAWWKQGLFVLAGLFAWYAVTGCIFASSVKLGGITPEPHEAPAMIDVMPGGAAEAAGLEDGDTIVELGGEAIDRWPDLPRAVGSRAGERAPVVVARGSSRQTFHVDIPAAAKIGVALNRRPRPVGVGEAALAGAALPAHTLVVVSRSLWVLAAGTAPPEQLGGPVGIVKSASARPTGAALAAQWLRALGSAASLYGLPLALIFGFITRVRRESAHELAD